MGWRLGCSCYLHAAGHHFHSERCLEGMFTALRTPEASILIVLRQMEAYTFLAGSLGSLSLTLWFLPVLYVALCLDFDILT